MSSGRKYTLAKVDRDDRLIEPRRKVEGGDPLEKVPRNLSIVLNGGFIRYLESVERPEVAIFTRVKVRTPQDAEETLVWEKVYLMSEDASEQMVLNKDTFLPRKDIPLLPGIKYNSDDEIYVSLRIVELDQEDNRRIRSLVNSAASATAAIEPDFAVGASVFQTVLSFITKSNPDDIEFQFDFALIPGRDDATIDSRDGKRYMVLPPRIGRYVVIKTEHRDRLVYPSNYFDMAQASLRYLLGSSLKLGTLGLFNWAIWNEIGADPEEDFYMKIMGRPFATDGTSWRIPEFGSNGLTLEPGGRIRLNGDTLVYDTMGTKNRTFVDQGYLTFSVIETKQGLNIQALRDANKAKQSIDAIVKTGQPTPEEFERIVGDLGSSVVKIKFKEELDQKLAQDLDAATSPQDVEAALDRAKRRLDDLKIPENLRGGLLPGFVEAAEKRYVEVKGVGDLRGSRLDRQTVILDGSTGLLNLIHPRSAKIEQIVGTGEGADASIEIKRSTGLDTFSYSTVKVTLSEVPDRPTRRSMKLLIADRLTEFHYWVVPPLRVTNYEVKGTSQSTFSRWGNDNPWAAASTLQITIEGTVEGKHVVTWLQDQQIDLALSLGGRPLEFTVDGAGRLLIENRGSEALDPREIVSAPVPLRPLTSTPR